MNLCDRLALDLQIDQATTGHVGLEERDFGFFLFFFF